MQTGMVMEMAASRLSLAPASSDTFLALGPPSRMAAPAVSPAVDALRMASAILSASAGSRQKQSSRAQQERPR